MNSSQSLTVDAIAFYAHCSKLYHIWETNYKKEFDAILAINPKEEGANMKAFLLSGWLFGFNLNETTLLFTKKEIVIFTSEKKINIVSSLKDHPEFNKLPVVFIKREKNAPENAVNHQRIFKYISNNGSLKVGFAMRDKKNEANEDELEKYLRGQSVEFVDTSKLLNECFSIKDKDEMDDIRRASKVTTYFLDKLISEVKRVIDQQLNHSHEQICQRIEVMFDGESPQMKRIETKLSKYNVKKESVDIGSSPMIQSGGNYHLKLLGLPNKDILKPDCIIVGFCSQYRLYNACVYRTLLINPTSDQEKKYEKILGLNKLLINNVKVGVKLSTVYNIAADYVRNQLPGLEVPSNFGYGMGLEYRENGLVINEKNDRVFQVGMTFLLVCGFIDITVKDAKQSKEASEAKEGGEKKYAIVLTDMVMITSSGVEVASNEAEKKLEDINFAIDFQVQPEKKDKKKDQPRTSDLPQRRKRQRKGEKNGIKLQSFQERNSHQEYLKTIKNQELKNRVDENFERDNKQVKEISYQKIECYKSKDDLPKDLQPGRIYVDNKANSVLFPIYGVHVPFHINVIKSVVKIQEGKLTALRFNFNMPVGGVVGNIRIPPPKDNNTFYVKELIYRMENTKGEPEVFKQVKELQKKMKSAADEQRNKEDIVDQAKLIINKNKKPLLRDLQVRPYHIKKIKGILECHTNGFRYTPNSNKAETLDIIFSNIKNAFFQPCEKEIFAAIHFRLHEPIMIGKKKTEDVQFYSEVGALIDDIQRRGRNEQDSDEEERERVARRRLDKQFEAFIKSCEEMIPAQQRFQFEVPRREYAFDGAPFKVKSLLQPTKTCLMNVTDMPFFVMRLDEVEVACFERMYANIRNFDLTFIYKDFEKYIRILSIPIEQVERIKDWLDRNNIIFYDLQMNVKWAKFLQNIRNNFKEFVAEGGWSAWDSDEDEKIQIEEEEGDSQFSGGNQSQEESEGGSDYSDDFDEDQDSGSYEDDNDLSEEGLDSEELEEHMERLDKEKKRKEFESEKKQMDRKNIDKRPAQKNTNQNKNQNKGRR